MPEGPMVRVDVHERGSLITRELAAAGARLEFVALKAGDYLVERSLLVERKSAWDFRMSLFDGRLFRQMSRLARAAPRPLLLIEGEDATLARPTYRGAILAVSGVFGIPVIVSKGPEDSAQWVLGAARQFAARREHAWARPGWRPRGKRARQVFILQGLPGVGPVRAERLLDRFGTVRAIVSAEEAALREVAGIGPTIARKIVWYAT